jgi:hypothetical protein
MYIDAVAKSVTLYLRHYVYNIILKIKQLYIASGPLPPLPPAKYSECAPGVQVSVCVCVCVCNNETLTEKKTPVHPARKDQRSHSFMCKVNSIP